MAITVQLRFFAAIRESIGHGSETCSAPVADVAALRDYLIARGAPYADALARGKAVRIAVDQHMCDESAPLRDSAEVAFFPPVTGG
jgi:molybdopterin synthase sulfur carrier subunit